ncbi:MAG: prolyl oligopeptidase family serine peptidase, partial [Micrococcales bacterium]|nr:prolyl oligopeptidase family serine peptidase [Micrococcales bacterium]
MSIEHQYPPARRDDLVEQLHGRTVADPYRWLEDAETPETQTWSTAQDQLWTTYRDEAAARLADGPFATTRLTARLHQLLDAGFVSPPAWRGDRRFFTRRSGDQEHPVVVVAEADGTERVLIDPVALSEDGTTTLDSWQPSKEGAFVAYQVSTGGTEESVLRVLDVATGADVDGPIDRARYSPVAWLPGGESFYYVRRLDPALVPPDEHQYHRRVWWHQLGTDPAQDVEVFGAWLPMTNYYGLQVSLDGRWLVISASEGTAPRTDVWLADIAWSSPQAPSFTEVIVGVDAETNAWVARDGRLYVHTDLDAPRGRLLWADPTNPRDWRPLLAQDDEAVLTDVAFVDDVDDQPTTLLASWERHAVSEITVHDPTTGERTGQVRLPGLGSVGGLVTRPEGGTQVWFTYTDHTTVSTVYRWTHGTPEPTVWAEPPGALADLPDVTVERLTTTSADGTTIRAFVIARTGLARPAPTVLYGYGGFQISLNPGYSATVLAWVEAGGVYVVANLRGGGEEGESWHRDGMRGNKQNVFDDLHAVADALVDQGWTTPEQLAVWGGSNGGLLVGATITQRPHTYAAALCSAPLLDMVRYQRFGLGATWSEEYGDAEVPEELDWLLSYSPYHHVTPGTRYPATLFTVFEGDTRVDTLHARKMAAALQAATTAPVSQAPVLVRLETGVGHGGRALSRSVALTVDEMQFVADRTGAGRHAGDPS